MVIYVCRRCGQEMEDRYSAECCEDFYCPLMEGFWADDEDETELGETP